MRRGKRRLTALLRMSCSILARNGVGQWCGLRQCASDDSVTSDGLCIGGIWTLMPTIVQPITYSSREIHANGIPHRIAAVESLVAPVVRSPEHK